MNNRTTIIMPVSREEYLDKIFAILELTECDRSQTNLLVIVDGDAELFVKTRNFVEQSKFAQRLCVQFPQKTKKMNYSTYHRKFRIAQIHNELKKYIWECDYIVGLEDDTIPPADFIKKLLKNYTNYPHAGFIEGAEVARWNLPYVGAWKIDDIYNPGEMHTLMPSSGLEEIDSGGFYCFITTRDNYMTHEFEVFERGNMGPDVNFGIELRKLGQLNYIDWSIKCEHKTGKKTYKLTDSDIIVCTMVKKDNGIWRQKHNA